MKAWITFILALGVLVACGEQVKKDATNSTQDEKVDVVADAEMTLSIEGMVCEHGCGGSIRKALKETGGVERVSFDFEDERPSNTATVKFDSKKTSKKEIISIISKLNDGQFTAKEIENNGGGSTNESGDSNESEKSTISSLEGNFEIPNIFELLSGLIL